MLDPSRVLFLGKGASAVCYYRVMLPAMAMGADWAGIHGNPPKIGVASSLIKGDTRKPELLSGHYDFVVLQQMVGPAWLDLIEKMQAQGIKVLFEIDDYLHAIPRMEDHAFRENFTPEVLQQIEESMAACDGMIVSTPYLKRKYGRYAKRTFVCPNGIDLARYDLESPEREDHINVGWAGATGHFNAVRPWFQQVHFVMQHHENVNFVSIGERYADAFREVHGKERALSVPFAAIEQYPSAMTLLDIALAPAGQNRFFRGKSDLRWIEAGALGIPVIADAALYSDIKQGETGFKASNAEQMLEFLYALINSPDLRKEIGANAKAYVTEHRTIQTLKRNWERAFNLLADEG